MARLNIDERYWSDPRRAQLIARLGCHFKADGMMLNAWKLAEQFWVPSKNPIPIKLWNEAQLDSALVVLGFAEHVEAEHVYVLGSEEMFAWRFKKMEAGKKGGLKNKGKNLKHSLAGSSLAKQNEASSSSSSSKEEEYIYKPTKEDLDQCTQVWDQTLSRMGINKSAKLDQVEIARILVRNGLEKTKLALLGAGFESASENYDPKNHVSIRRLHKPDMLEKFINLGAQNKPVESEVQEWELPASLRVC